MKRLSLALACAFAALTVGAAAQIGHGERVRIHHSGPMFDIDADNDGWVSRAEASAAADAAFARLDDDGDGRLSATHHVHIETGGDGRRVEIVRDRDVETHVERHEDRDVIIRRVEGPGGHRLDDAEMPALPLPPIPPSPPMFMMLFANSEEADTNGDGALSREEFRAQHLRFFDASDANGDGRVRLSPPAEPPIPPAPPAPPEPPRRR